VPVPRTSDQPFFWSAGTIVDVAKRSVRCSKRRATEHSLRSYGRREAGRARESRQGDSPGFITAGSSVDGTQPGPIDIL